LADTVLLADATDFVTALATAAGDDALLCVAKFITGAATTAPRRPCVVVTAITQVVTATTTANNVIMTPRLVRVAVTTVVCCTASGFSSAISMSLIFSPSIFYQNSNVVVE
jgi:hypothetical protein